MKQRFTKLLAAVALLVGLAIPMGMWGQVVSGTTYSTTSPSSLPQGWSGEQQKANNTSYFSLTYSTDYIQTANFVQSGFTSIKLKARMYGGPNEAEKVISVSWYNSDTKTETVLGTISPGDKNLNDYTIESPATVTEGEGYVKIQCKGAASNKGCGVSEVTLTFDGGATPTTYTVTYNANGGSGSMTDSNSPYTAGGTVTVLENEFTRTDYEFDHWNTEADDSGTDYDEGDTFTINANTTLYAQWTENTTPTPEGETLTFDFEEETAHRTSGNNSYSGTNTYSENDATITLTYADAVTTGSPLFGSANVMGRIAKNTTNSPIIHIGAIDITNKTITSIAYYTKGVAAMSQVLEYSLNNTDWSTLLTLSSMPTQSTNETASNLSITGTNLYLRWTTSVSSSTNSNRDFQLDQIVITYTSSSTNPSFTISNNNELAYDATSGSFNFTVINPVEGGTTSIAEDVDWISEAAISGNSVTFTTTTNEAFTPREGVITLTYTYGDNDPVTKDVTITQAAAPVIYNTIPALFEAATATSTPVTVSFGNWVVTGVNGNQSFVTDGTNGFIMYQSGHGFQVGNTLSGTADCNLVLFNGSAQITGLKNTTEGLVVGQNGTVTPVITTINALQAVNTGSVVTLKNLTYNGEELTDENDNTIVYHTSLYNGTTLETGAKYNVTGVFAWNSSTNSSTKRILPRSAADIEQIFTKTINAYTSDGSGEEPANGWYLIASPLTENTAPTAINGLVASDGHYDLYRFNQNPTVTNNDYLEWENYKIHSNDFVLENGKGYLYASQASTTLYFNGECNTGDTKTVDLDYSETNPDVNMRGWNLVGNPFTTASNINLPFYKMNDGGTALTSKLESGTIAAMEGAFVYAYDETSHQAISSVTFTASRSRGNSNASVNIDVMHNGAAIDNAIVRFDEGRQLPKYQLFKNSTKLYIPKNGKDYAIVNSEAQGEMPVNFKAEENGTYTLSVNTENVEMNYLHLIDNMTGMDVDLLQTPSYTFDATTNDYTSRFRLVFSANNVNEQNAETFAFFSNGNWVIGNEGEATLQVIDVNGRIVSNETINGTVATSINATPGVYMLRLVNGNEVKTQKIVVR